MKPRSTLLAFGLGALTLVGAASAQQTPGPTTQPASASAEETPTSAVPAVPAVPVTPDLESPRATMRTLLEALRDLDYTRAVSTLDLEGADVPRNVALIKGRELATQLKDSIDRIAFVNFVEIPDTGDGAEYVFFEAPEGSISIGRLANGDWKFSGRTLLTLPALHRSLLEREVVAGIVEVDRTLAQSIRNAVPESLLQVVFLELWQWIALAGLVLVGGIVDRIVLLLLRIGAAPGLRKISKEADQDVVFGAFRPLGMLAMAAIWWLGLSVLDLPAGTLQVLLVATRFVAASAAVWTAFKAVDVGCEILARKVSQTNNRYDDLLVPLFRSSAKVFLGAFGLVFIADNLDIEVRSILAGLGLGGVAVALAAQDTVKNLFGSLTVLLDRPFTVGDWVVIDGREGTVEEFGFRSIRIRTFYNSLITLPNGNLISAAVDNYGERRYRRWKTTISLNWDTPAEQVEAFCEGTRELIRRHPYTRKDYYHVYLNEFGASSLDVMLYMFFETPDWNTELRERHRLALDILRLGRTLDVSFAFPTRTVHLHEADASPTSSVVAASEFQSARTGALDESRSTARDVAGGHLEGAAPPPVDFDDYPGA